MNRKEDINRKISVVIPCLNEAEGLRRVLGAMPSFVDEAVVVDNGCIDQSRRIAREYRARIVPEKVRGYGSAISRGLKDTRGQLILIIDADGSYPIEVLKQMLLYMEKGNLDFVSGCRLPLSQPKAMPLANKICNYFISWLIRRLFKINLVDSQSGMMLLKREILDKIAINNKGMGFSQEAKIKAYLCPEIAFSELHIPYLTRIGRIKFKKSRDSIKNLYDLFVLRAQLGCYSSSVSSSAAMTK